jgi:hypothetical protein
LKVKVETNYGFLKFSAWESGNSQLTWFSKIPNTYRLFLWKASLMGMFFKTAGQVDKYTPVSAPDPI